MLKLMIVDDEKVIRETIRNLIGWEELGIEVVGTCKDGLEAYDMILDENPDIVMTDIKMPGLSGLELLEKTKALNPAVEFIILSGYGEFSFATQAMRNGVQHYLLKPCNEADIISVINDVKQKCYEKKAREEHEDSLLSGMRENVIRNIIAEYLGDPECITSLISKYERYLDFSDTPYHLFYTYYLEEDYLNSFLADLFAYHHEHFPGICLYPIYVKNTLLVFFESFQDQYEDLNDFILSWTASGSSRPETHQISYPNLLCLLKEIFPKLSRYDIVYTLNESQKIPTCNYNTLLHSIDNIIEKLNSRHSSLRNEGIFETTELLSQIQDFEFLKTLVSSFLLRSTQGKTSQITEMLLGMPSCKTSDELRENFLSILEDLFPESDANQQYKDFIKKAVYYIEENLSNPDLSLKWIVDNYLFMNVDYVSKQFQKQTGFKFSTYLNNVRIERAKQLLIEGGTEKMYTIADEIGCGNNPQYFSQLFKKYTGLTPTAYIKQIKQDT